MKTLCILAVLSCFAYIALAEVGTSCKSNDDCSRNECCVQVHLRQDPQCQSLRKKDDWCVPGLKLGDTTSHRYFCPCDEGLECTAEDIEEEDGATIYKNPKCSV
ncbi:unnamed protein product [Larinioides sclopetarius]|uniref:Uncharacterized protein n=1 Tax=Larinioides sclopetarius TaxID=280406 RepID=A0AAV1ZE69_9ARAC